MRALAIGILAVALLVPAAAARAAFEVDASGACVDRWESSDMLRGPTAILNGPLLPFRTMAGGGQYAWDNEAWWPYQIAVLGPAVTLFSGAAGVVEGGWWICTGLADTLTGGYFALSSARATDLSIEPYVPTVIADAGPSAPATDRCGRPLATPPAK